MLTRTKAGRLILYALCSGALRIPHSRLRALKKLVELLSSRRCCTATRSACPTAAACGGEMVQDHRDAITAAPREWARPASMAFIVGCPRASSSSCGALGAAGWTHDRQRCRQFPALTSRARVGSRRWMNLADAHPRARRWPRPASRPLPLCLIVMFPLYMTLSSNSPVSLEKPAGLSPILDTSALVNLLAKRRVD